MSKDVSTKDQNSSKNKKGFRMPHIYTILIIIIVIMSILTYIVPAGEYNRVEGPDGRMIIDPNSYHQLEQSPVGILDIFVAIPQGFVESAWIIALVFCAGGAFKAIEKTGAIEIGVKALANKLSNKGILVVPIFMAIFGTIDAFIGMPELCLVYIPIVLPLVRALGFDSITAAAIVLFGSAAGFVGGLTNPYTIGVAQKIAGLPLYSGIEFRLITYLVFLSVVILYVTQYAKKVKTNPKLSVMYELDKQNEVNMETTNKDIEVTKNHKLVGIAAGILFAITIFGVLKYQWDMPQMGGMFVIMGIVCGLLGGLSGEEIPGAFIEGFQDVIMGAIVIGVARGVAVVMNQGMIMDTIVYQIGNAIQGLPGAVTAVGMFIVQSVFNFLVPSGSGQATVTMPIMAPLADLVGVTRQTAVLAFQFGDGWSNIIFPTSGYFMATLALAKVPWEKWIEAIIKLFFLVMVVSATFLIIAHAIQWGPF